MSKTPPATAKPTFDARALLGNLGWLPELLAIGGLVALVALAVGFIV
jgi:hypothetical protein